MAKPEGRVNRREWTENARSCAQRAAWAITEARQALIDARRAATFAGEADWVALVQKAMDASRDLPQLLQDTLNVMDGGTPWYAEGKLNPPKDIDSAGEGNDA